MATQKQRRRREKEKRHEYDLVEIDEEGNETVIRATELREAAGPPARVRGSAKKSTQPPASGRRGEPRPPSWTRVSKRAAIFAPAFFVVLLLIGGNRMTVVGALIQVVILMIFFVPFSYFMDRFMWNSHQKRLAKGRGGGR